jgi:predicted MPP superfamily phosphohydrolase
MKWLGPKTLHTLMLLTDKPGRWVWWQIAPILLILAAGMGLIWARTTGTPAAGWAISLSLLAFVLADWILLAALPRWGLSFGMVQPPLLGLTVARWSIALLAVPAAVHWTFPALAATVLGQCFAYVLLAYGTMVEPFRLRVSRVAVPNPRFNRPGTPLSIVQLSDLHIERLTRRERALPDLVAQLSPDLVVITGDFLSTSYRDDPHALADLRRLLAQIHAPGGVYAVWGTHEVDLPALLRPVLTGLGIVILEDQAIEISIHGHRLWLMGLSCRRDLDAGGPRLRSLLADAPPSAYRILLHHSPDVMPQASALGVDLVLSGHTHGGQWRLPGFGAILTSSRYWKRYEAGYYREGETILYVSRGLGMEGFGMPRARFFCPPEVVSITLAGTKGQR